MGAATSLPAGARLSKDGRRQQLLNVAVEIIVDRGIAALTMEGLAERSGVSKALPYQHFENAKAVLLALHDREIAMIGARVVDAVAGVDDPEDRVRRAVHAYLDVVVERGHVLGLFVGPGEGSLLVAERGGSGRVGVDFIAELLVKPFGFTGRQATMLSSMFLGALSGALESWVQGDGSRSAIERTYVAIVIAGLNGVR